MTVLAIGAAVLVWYVAFSDEVQRARDRCAERGGQVVIVSDAQSIGQYCVLPNGEKEPL